MIAETRRSEIFTSEIEDLGKRLLHHQCWFFGRDIFHPEGNLFIRNGFERRGLPEGVSGSTYYRLRLSDKSEINLWGWGIFFGNEKSGIFIKRYDFRPRLLKTGKLNLPVFKSENLPPSHIPREDFNIETARSLTLDLIEWILLYEDRVEKTCGKKWRQKCLREWQNAAFPARRIRKNWRELAVKIGEL